MSKVEEDVKGSAAVVGDGAAVTAGDGTPATTASAGASVDIEAHAREWERGAATLRSHEGLPFSVLSNQAQMRDFLAKYDAFCLDCDGVLWHAGHELPRVSATLAALRKAGKRLFFVTNNSTKSRAQYRQKFEVLGIQADIDEIYCSGYCAAQYLKLRHPDVRKALTIGAKGLADELASVGVTAKHCPASDSELTEAEYMAMSADADVGAVVVGWDLGFSFRKLCYASLCLQHLPDCVFIATNLDPCDRLADRTIPGNGCAVAAIETSVGRKAVVAGKPSKFLVELLVAQHGLDPARTCMFGDRLSTDIEFGNEASFGTVLVLSGTTSVEQAQSLQAGSRQCPTHVLAHFGLLFDAAAAE